MRRRPLSATLFAVLALVAISVSGVGLAVAAAPVATTTAATDVTATTATLNGEVEPNQEDTTYRFEYGTTTAYGTQTPVQGPIGGNPKRKVDANVTGLAPRTTYHYRVIATNPSGTVFGADMTFTTPAAGAPGANSLTIKASPTRVTFGRSTTISGQLTGTGNAGVEVTLEANPHPFTGGFKATNSKTTTSATGTYSFAVTPALNTRYRVSAKTRPPVTSAEVTVNVRVRVSFRLSDRTPAVGQRVRFSGIVTPGHDGRIARIQRRTSTGRWATVARATLRAATPVNGVARSRYAKRLRIRRSGTYRVRVTPGDGDHVLGTSVRRRARVHS